MVWLGQRAHHQGHWSNSEKHNKATKPGVYSTSALPDGPALPPGNKLTTTADLSKSIPQPFPSARIVPPAQGLLGW